MKAILVIDIPDGIFIEDCVIDYEVQESVMRKVVTDGMKRLRPLPERKSDDHIRLANMINSKSTFQEFAEGWNACLREIEPYGGFKTTGYQSVKPIK